MIMFGILKAVLIPFKSLFPLSVFESSNFVSEMLGICINTEAISKLFPDIFEHPAHCGIEAHSSKGLNGLVTSCSRIQTNTVVNVSGHERQGLYKRPYCLPRMNVSPTAKNHESSATKLIKFFLS